MSDSNQSLETLEKNLQTRPNDGAARIELASLYLDNGSFAEAEQHLRRALTCKISRDQFETIHLCLGEIRRRQGQIREAIDEFQTALNTNPSGIPARLALGDLHTQEENFEAAEEHLRQALALATDNGAVEGAHHRLGELHRAQQHFDEAMHHFSEVIRIKPHSLSARLELGDICAKQGKWQEAEDHYKKALSIEDIGNKAEFAHYRLGEIYRIWGRFEEAIEHFEKVFRLNPNHGLAKIEIAKIYRERRMFAESEKSLREALNTPLDPSTAKWTHIELATIFQHTGRPMAESVKEYQEASRIAPQDEALRAWLDQPKQVKGFRSETPPYRPHFTWNILSACNYGCSYCSAPTKIDKMEDRDKACGSISADQWIKIWKKVHETYGLCRIRLSGGEPSLYRGFHEVVGGVSQWHIIQMNTNLSFDVKKFVEKANPKMVRIDASFHPEFPKTEPFLEKIRILRERGFRMIVSVVAFPPFMEKMADFKRDIESLGSNFMIHPFYGMHDGKNYPDAYTPREREIIFGLHDASRVNLQWQTADAFRAKGKKCRMGQMYATIFPDGEVYRCCNHDYRLNLGDMTKGTFRLLDEPAACEAEECQCWRSMVLQEEERWAWQWVDDWEVYAETNPFIPEITPPSGGS